MENPPKIVVHRVGDAGDAPIQIGAYVWREPDWDRFLRQVEKAECAVVVCQRPLGRDTVGRLRELRFAHPWLPLVLCTNASRSVLRELSHIVDQLVVLHEELPEVLHAIRAASRAQWLRGFARRVDELAAMDAHLKRMLRLAVEPAIPYAFVKELSRAAEVSPATAGRYWREHWNGSPPLRLAVFLVWIVILRAHAAKHPRTSWKGVTSRLGVSRKRLRRWVRACLGLPDLAALEELTNAELDAYVESAVCAPLFGEPSGEKADRLTLKNRG